MRIMQIILIIWPVLLCAFLTSILLAWVLFVALPRLRRVDKLCRESRRRKPLDVDTDQQAIRRSL